MEKTIYRAKWRQTLMQKKSKTEGE